MADFIAPPGLRRRIADLPFLGRLTCSHDRLTAGAWEEVVLDYEVGGSGIADGAWLKITFKFYSDWALFQTVDPAAAHYLSAEYQAAPTLPGQRPATVQSLKTRFDQKGHERPYQKAIIIDTVDGYLKPGDRITVRLGDRRQGGPGTRVQTFVEKDFRFRAYVDPLGTSRFAAVEGDVVLQVVPGLPEKLTLLGPRLAREGERVDLTLRAEDRWGNACVDLGNELSTALVRSYLPNGCVRVAPITLNPTGWAFARFPWPGGDAPPAGESLVEAWLEQRPAVKAAPFALTVDAGFPFPRSFYADLHVHSDDTVGINDTPYNLSYGRDVAALDILGYTANDFQITHARWEQAVADVRAVHEDGRFVTYPGIEWCGNSAVGGDHNVVFLHDRAPEFPFTADGRPVRSFEWNEDMTGKGVTPGTWPLEALYEIFADDPEGHLFIPHVGGRRCNLDWHHPELERLIEVASSWGHFHWLYQDAMARGYKLGASAAGDEHRGRAGGGAPGASVFGTRGGLTGVLAEELTRDSVATALRAGRTWATTGERLVGLAWSGGYLQGDSFSADRAVSVGYRFLGDAGWDEIAAFDHAGLIWRRNLQQEAGYSSRRIRLRWGGARVLDRYRWAEWRGKVTVLNGTVDRFEPRGFEHVEEAAWRDGPVSLGFRSDTFGDDDALELEISNLAQATIKVEGTIGGYVKIGDPRAGAPFVHRPDFAFEIRGADLLAAADGNLRLELGGVGLFVAFERLADAPLPRDVSGSLTVEPVNGPHGHRPLFLRARQIDDAKVWTSALYIHFQ